jgi:hypothetical protein
MSIFKRGNVYWYHFMFNGEHVQKSTKQGNPRTARQIEAAKRTALAKGEVGIEARKTAPMFSAIAKRFLEHVEARHENKPQTVQFYAAKLNRLLEYAPIAGARLDRIDEGIIEGYVVARRATVGPATVNRELATLRRMLRLAHEWKEIQRIPKIRQSITPLGKIFPGVFSTLYAIQCLLGLGNREWTLSPSCGLPVTAASWFRSGTSIQPRRQWSGLSSGCNCPAISP